MGSRHFWGLAMSAKCQVSNSRSWWSFLRVWVGQSSAAYSAHNRDGCIDAQLLVIQICSRVGKVFQRSVPPQKNCTRLSAAFSDSCRLRTILSLLMKMWWNTNDENVMKH